MSDRDHDDYCDPCSRCRVRALEAEATEELYQEQLVTIAQRDERIAEIEYELDHQKLFAEAKAKSDAAHIICGDARIIARAEALTLTLDGFAQTWLAEPALFGMSNVTTDRQRRSRWRVHVSDTNLGRTPLALVRRDDVIVWLKALHAKGLARTTLQSALSLVHLCFKAAMLRAYIPDCPTRDVKVSHVAGRVPQ